MSFDIAGCNKKVGWGSQQAVSLHGLSSSNAVLFILRLVALKTPKADLQKIPESSWMVASEGRWRMMEGEAAHYLLHSIKGSGFVSHPLKFAQKTTKSRF